MAQLIDGKLISQQIKDELKEEVEQFKAEGIDICLAVIQVGSDPASSVYVRNKKKACAYIGVESRSYELPEETSEEELIKLVEELNADESVNGILVQLPVPDHIDEDKIIRTISPDKDVDGFHPVSVGRLWIGEKGFLSCTPAGIIQLLKRSNISMMKNSINTGVFPPTVSMINKSTNSGKSSTRSVPKSYPIGLSVWRNEESNCRMF